MLAYQHKPRRGGARTENRSIFRLKGDAEVSLTFANNNSYKNNMLGVSQKDPKHCIVLVSSSLTLHNIVNLHVIQDTLTLVFIGG